MKTFLIVLALLLLSALPVAAIYFYGTSEPAVDSESED